MRFKASLTMSILLAAACALGQSPGQPAVPSPAAPRPTRLGRAVDLPPAPPDWGFVCQMALSRFSGIEKDATLKFLQEYMAEELAVLKQKSSVRPDDVVVELTDLIQKALELMENRRARPERFEKLIRERQIERQVQRLREAVAASEGKERDEKVKELKSVLDQAFEIRQELMKMEVAWLSRELEKLKSLVQKREENRAGIVARRMSELTGQEDALRW